MSTFAISHIPLLRPRVEELLASSAPLSSIARDVLGLVPPELAFSLVLSSAYPVFMDLSRPASRRMSALFVAASLQGNSSTPELDPFRSSYLALLSRDTQGDAALEDWEKDEVDVDEQVLDWALWHILAGLKDKLGSFTSESLTTSPFPLPIETSFGLPSTSSDPRSGSRSRETSPTRNTLAQLVRLTYLAKERALTSKEEKMIPSLLPSLSPLLPFIFPPLFLAPITQHNPTLAEVFLLHLHTAHPDHRGTYIDALASLPPTLPSLDLISKLLREPVSGAEEENDVSLGEVVRFDVLGRFWGQVVDQLDGLEVRRRAGSGGSGQVEEELARGVSIACRFITSLLTSKTIARDDGVAVEATSFTLRFSRFSQAQMLYRTLVGEEGGGAGGFS